MLIISAVYFMWNPEICQDAQNTWAKILEDFGRIDDEKKMASDIFQPLQ